MFAVFVLPKKKDPPPFKRNLLSAAFSVQRLWR